MRERLRQLGGTLEIKSNGRGTLVGPSLLAFPSVRHVRLWRDDSSLCQLPWRL